MKFLGKLFLICLLVFVFLWVVDVVIDRHQLSNELIRLHVVADSDSDEDQAIKLQVRDAVTEYLQNNMPQNANKEEVMAFLQQNITQLTETANAALEKAGTKDKAVITLTREAFPKREYETFSLPSGVYDSLRIRIGEAEGQNWWCVVFPSLCFTAVGEDLSDTAAGAGFDEPLVGALEREDSYQIRFFFLDCLGWLQNFFHQF